MNFNNFEIRQAIDKNRLKYYEVAQAAGIDNCTFSKWLRTELSGERKEIILQAIKELSENG